MFRIFPHLDLTSLERFVIFYIIDSPPLRSLLRDFAAPCAKNAAPKTKPEQSTHPGIAICRSGSPTLTLILKNMFETVNSTSYIT